MVATPYLTTLRPMLTAAVPPAIVVATLVLSPDPIARLVVGVLGLVLLLLEARRERVAVAQKVEQKVDELIEQIAVEVAEQVATDSLAVFQELLAGDPEVLAELSASKEK